MNQNTVELAISALEAERMRIVLAIAELKSGLNGRATARTQALVAGAAVVAPAKAVAGGRKRGMTAAGRKALALAAKRRWAKAKAAGKSSL